MRNTSAETLSRMQKRADTLDSSVATIKNDDSRSSEYKIKEIARIRGEALPAMGADLATLRSNAKSVATSQAAWSSKPYLLGKQRFDADPALDTSLRARYSTELRQMDNELLQLTISNAKEERNLPLLYLGYLASLATHTDPTRERIDVDLSDVSIPDQREALDALGVINSAIPQAELAAKSALASGPTPVDKMNAQRSTLQS